MIEIRAFVNAIVYAIMGIVIFIGTFALVDLMTPYDLWKELNEERNIALAIVVGAAALGICIIIAAAVH